MTSLKTEVQLWKQVVELARRLRSIGCLTILVCLAGLMNLTQAAAQEMIAVPSYSNPGDATWNAEEAQSQKVKIMIINLNNGDDTTFHRYVLTAVQQAQAAGIRVLSYTYTRYGKRNPLTVIKKINAAAKNYGIDGIFFEEAPTSCKASTRFHRTTHQYYKKLTDIVHNWGSLAVLNPGTQPPTKCWMDIADILLDAEDDGLANYKNGYVDYPWIHNYAPNRFWHVIYGVISTSDMKKAVDLSKSRNAGYVYVTSDGADGNPHDDLPTYWLTEVSYVN